MALDDQALIARVVLEGDQHAFSELVKRYQSQLRNSLRQLTGFDEALADDLAQETFIKAYQALHKFRGEAKFFTWLYRIAYNCFAAHMRSRKPEDSIGDDELPDPGSDESGERDLQRDFARALSTFSPDQRMALHLHMQREFTHQEVADIMECPLGTVKSHIQRGRERLQLIMQDWQV